MFRQSIRSMTKQHAFSHTDSKCTPFYCLHWLVRRPISHSATYIPIVVVAFDQSCNPYFQLYNQSEQQTDMYTRYFNEAYQLQGGLA